MQENNYFNVGQNFDLNALVDALVRSFTIEGYRVEPRPMTSGLSVTFKKNTSGFKKILGLSRQVTTNFSINDQGMLLLSFSNPGWGDKAFALAVGWFLFWIPFATGLYGIYKQSELPKEITSKVEAVISGYGINC